MSTTKCVILELVTDERGGGCLYCNVTTYAEEQLEAGITSKNIFRTTVKINLIPGCANAIDASSLNGDD